MVVPMRVIKTTLRLVALAAFTQACTFTSEESDGFPSVHMQQFKAVVRPYKLTTSTTEKDLMDDLGDRDYPKIPKTPKSLSDVAEVDQRKVGDFKVLELVPRRKRRDLRILYFHGGGYIYELSQPQLVMLAELIERTGASITVPVYPLAPEFTHEDAFPFVERVYQELLDDGPASNIVLAGDSAGGGLALSQVFRYRQLGLDLPSKLVLISPWLDVTMSNPLISTLEGVDCVLEPKALQVYGKWWAHDQEPSDPLFSPLFGDLTGLPPVLLIAGTDEVLLPDIRQFAREIDAEHVQVLDADSDATSNAPSLYFEYPGGFHDFPLASVLPEAKDSLNRMAAFLKE